MGYSCTGIETDWGILALLVLLPVAVPVALAVVLLVGMAVPVVAPIPIVLYSESDASPLMTTCGNKGAARRWEWESDGAGGGEGTRTSTCSDGGGGGIKSGSAFWVSMIGAIGAFGVCIGGKAMDKASSLEDDVLLRMMIKRGMSRSTRLLLSLLLDSITFSLCCCCCCR